MNVGSEGAVGTTDTCTLVQRYQRRWRRAAIPRGDQLPAVMHHGLADITGEPGTALVSVGL